MTERFKLPPSLEKLGDLATNLWFSWNPDARDLYREIDLDTDLLIAVQPTRGLDVGAIEYIHKRLIEQRDSGKAVLLVSLELDEILDLSDRIAVVNSGELIDLVVNDDSIDENDIGLMMAGVKKGEA